MKVAPADELMGQSHEQLSAELDQAHQVAAALVAERDELRQKLAGAEQALDAATGPHCSSCGEAIDPDCCWCGDGPGDGRWRHADDHSFIPMGCDCGRGERDWRKVASAVRERLWHEKSARFAIQEQLDAATLSDADRDALRYAARLITNNPVAGCVDSISKNHTNMVNAARAVIARLLGGITL